MNAPVEAGVAPYVTQNIEREVCTLTLNRGTRYNPLSLAMIDALDAALDAAAADAAVRVVVIAADGKGFCAGHDLKELRAHRDIGWQRTLFARCNAMMQKLTQLPQPTIARVHGIATAAGCQLVSMCDLAVAADSATFALPGLNTAVFCSTPAVGVGRNVARKRTMEMLLTAAPIDAATALDWGLVNRVVPVAGLDAAIDVFVTSIVMRSAPVVALGKRAFYAQIERDLAGAYALAGETMACNLLADDAAEGIDAFVAKRAPQWPSARGGTR
ncbi:MAG TPA: enoyl-CoA hydratase [Casimicrobiaceae bacterium]|jgi:enoyl-CoA hydratase/carnithine racemase